MLTQNIFLSFGVKLVTPPSLFIFERRTQIQLKTNTFDRMVKAYLHPENNLSCTVIPIVCIISNTVNVKPWNTLPPMPSLLCRPTRIALFRIQSLDKGPFLKLYFTQTLQCIMGIVNGLYPRSYLAWLHPPGAAAMVQPSFWRRKNGVASILTDACFIEWPLWAVCRSLGRLRGLFRTFSSLQAPKVAARELRLLNFLAIL